MCRRETHAQTLQLRSSQAIKLDGFKISEVSQIFNINRNTIRLWLKRERFSGLKSGKRQGRVNMIVAYYHGQLCVPFTIEGSGNRTVERNLVNNLFDTEAKTGTNSDCG